MTDRDREHEAHVRGGRAAHQGKRYVDDWRTRYGAPPVGDPARSPLVTRADVPREIHVTGVCDAGAHKDCRPSLALIAAGGCECGCHKEWEDLRDDRD